MRLGRHWHKLLQLTFIIITVMSLLNKYILLSHPGSNRRASLKLNENDEVSDGGGAHALQSVPRHREES